MAETIREAICRRCRVNKTSIVARNEPMCADCFTKYVNTKVIKRLDTFSTRHAFAGAQKRLLVPLSLGPCSIALLHMLDRQIRWQIAKSGRSGFVLYVVHVYNDSTGTPGLHLDSLDHIKSCYPDHDYTILPLSHAYRDALTADSVNTGTAAEKLFSLLSQVTEVSARADLEAIFLRRLLVRHARENNLDGILWGDSTTRLAEKVLSESAKGRGFSLPWSVTEGETPFGVLYHFPLQDVLKKELLEYARYMDPPLTSLYATNDSLQEKPLVSSRNMTIDLLSKQYFESVEASYPSIVSNVVRTSIKLEPATVSLQRCSLCQFPVTAEQAAHGDWQGLQEGPTMPASADSVLGVLCYGCSRTISVDLLPLLPNP